MKNLYFLFLPVIFLSSLVFAQHMPNNPMQKQITFVSQPPLSGQKNVSYVYTAKAISRDTSDVIRYSGKYSVIQVFSPQNFPIDSMILAFSPQNFPIDSISGVVNWTPRAKGWYAIELIARSNKGSYAIQPFSISVTGGNGIVQGHVTDTLNVGIPDVIIEVLQASMPQMMSPEPFTYLTKTNSSGNYRISGIDPGNYKLHAVAHSPELLSQWYDGKSNPSEANTISIADSPAVSIANFILRSSISHQQRITVAGSVTDTAQSALSNAQVFFVESGFALNTNNTINDFRNYFDLNAPFEDCHLDGHSIHAFQAHVDSIGKYSLQLLPGTYIAFAKAPGYATEFYNEQSDLLSATQITLQQNTRGINFTLAHLPPVALGSMSGSVIDSSRNVSVQARIIASRDHWMTRDSISVARSYVVDTDSLGNYSVGNLVPGSYFIFAIPLGNYSPAFYSNDTINTQWKRATKVIINGNSVSDINIYVHEIPTSTSGYGGISGMIQSNVVPSLQAGTLVYANKGTIIAGFAITEASGNYTISGLAPGTYSVSVDRLGFSEVSAQTVSISYSVLTGAPQNATANFSIQQLTGVSQQTSTSQPVTFKLDQNYPNPFNPTTTINYSLGTSGTVSLKIYNLIGQEIATLVSGFQNAGTYRVTFNAQGFASGVYFYRLHASKADLTRKMIVIQ